MEAVCGSWKMDNSNNDEVEDFMNKVGLPEDMTKKLMARDYRLTYKSAGSNALQISVKVLNDPALGEATTVVEMGKEKECESIDKDKVKLLIKFEGGKFNERYHDLVRGGVYDIVREVKGDVMTVTTTMKEHSVTQKWNRC